MAENKCHRCGQCCSYEKDGITKKCPYLIGKGKITSCRIYKDPKRLGKKLDNGIFCTPRALDTRTFLGCPYNKK